MNLEFGVCLQVEQCRMPGLAIYLTLDAGKANAGGMGGSSLCGGEGGDVVSYVTGLLLSPNQPQRSWFAQFVKSGQRVSLDLQLFLFYHEAAQIFLLFYYYFYCYGRDKSGTLLLIQPLPSALFA